MSVTTRQTHQPPSIDATAMVNRKRQEAELFSLDNQLRTFTPLREQLTAAGQDATAYYRDLQAQRAKLAATLKSAPSISYPKLPPAQLDGSLLDRPISAARFNPNLGYFGFGSSGIVQVAPAAECLNIIPTGQYPVSGDITTIPGSESGAEPGAVTFTGNPAVGPPEVAVNQYSPAIEYYWLHSWEYLVPFPPPATRSILTYTFHVYASVGISYGGIGTLMSFVSMGQTSDLVSGTNVTVDINGGFPINADLSQTADGPNGWYNGSYGALTGLLPSVKGSFEVDSLHVPGVAIVVGVIVGLPMQSQVELFFGGLGYSEISIGSAAGLGRIEYSYTPQLVLE